MSAAVAHFPKRPGARAATSAGTTRISFIGRCPSIRFMDKADAIRFLLQHTAQVNFTNRPVSPRYSMPMAPQPREWPHGDGRLDPGRADAN